MSEIHVLVCLRRKAVLVLLYEGKKKKKKLINLIGLVHNLDRLASSLVDYKTRK